MPFEYLSTGVRLSCLEKHDLTYELTSFNIKCKKIVMNKNMLNKSMSESSSYDDFIQYFHNIDKKNFELIVGTKGLFIMCENPGSISKIKLVVDNASSSTSTSNINTSKMFNINNKMLYVPFSGEHDYNNLDKNSYNHVVDYCKLLEFKISTEKDDDFTEYSLFSINSNSLKYSQGMAGVLYTN